MKSFLHEVPRKKIRQRAIVIEARRKQEKASYDEGILEELASLCRTAGAVVVGQLSQTVDRYNPTTLIGSGKVEELAKLVRELKADIVVFDSPLTPSQQVNLEERLGKQVIDRPGVILDIFALHARTREAQAQVELAQMQYLLPRLAGGWTHLERQEGAIGTRGPGETQLETDRRLVRKRIAQLQRKLRAIEEERHTQRKKRQGLFKVCLVGYTNAGKSTVFNMLTGETVTSANYLFATLDSTTRRVKMAGKNKFLLSDTVGFIRRLPVELVASFKSTLMEVSEADLLLHIIDIADREFETKMATVGAILNEIGCGELPILPVFNKIDKRNDPDLFRSLLSRHPGARFISASTGEGLHKLKSDLMSLLEKSNVTIEARVKLGDKKSLNLLSSLGYLLDTSSHDGMMKVIVKLPIARLGKLQRQGVDLVRLGFKDELPA